MTIVLSSDNIIAYIIYLIQKAIISDRWPFKRRGVLLRTLKIVAVYILITAVWIFQSNGIVFSGELTHPLTPSAEKPSQFYYPEKFHQNKGTVSISNNMQPPQDLLFITDIEFENYPDAGRMLLRTNRYFDYFDYAMDEGSKIVLDPVEPIYANIAGMPPKEAGLIVSYAFAKSHSKEKRLPEMLKQGFYPVDFLVIELKSPKKYNIIQRAGLLVIDAGDRRLPRPLEFTPSNIIRKRLKKLARGLAKPKKDLRSQAKASDKEPPIEINLTASFDNAPKSNITPKRGIRQPAAKRKEYKSRKPPSRIKPLPKGMHLDKLKLALPPPKIGFSQGVGAEPLVIDPMKVNIGKRLPPTPKKAKQPDKIKQRPFEDIMPVLERIQQKPIETADIVLKEDQPMGMAFGHYRDEVLAKAYKLPRMAIPGGKKALSLNECLQVATYNHMPLMVAGEEVRLNQMKINEAKRALYPSATAKAVRTDGESSGVEFIEETYGLQVEQPLYYGGRLKLTLRQAQINREVAQSKYDKAEAELVAKVTEKFFSLVTSQLNLQDQLQLIDESRQIRLLTKKKYKMELITQLELLNVETQSNQIEYQLSVGVKDFEIARLNLLQAMGVGTNNEISADYTLDYKERIIDLNECLLLAYQNRPELHMHELLNEASEYEVKIAKSKDKFKVDLSGFFGTSAGAFVTEPLDFDDDWFLGLKMSKPLGTSTSNYSFAQNQTSPKVGQSTRTGGTSHTVEFNILNNYAGLSEKQSAYVSLLKAETELIEMEKSINVEVREAYNNYQKSIFQIKNTTEKIRFRREEVKILEMQASLNEALSSQVLEAKVKFADEKALYHQAIASYKTALANLNKTIGLIGYFR